MKKLTNMLLATGASLALSVAAFAQDIELTNASSGAGEIGGGSADVALSTFASASQLADLVFTITPGSVATPAADFGATTPSDLAAGADLTIALDNLILSSAVGTTAATITGSVAASGTNCAASVAAATITIASGGVATASSVTFDFGTGATAQAVFANCDNATDGFIQITLPVALVALETANFSAAIDFASTSLDAQDVAATDFDADVTNMAGTPLAPVPDPLVTVVAPFAVTFTAASPIPDLALGSEVAFSLFENPAAPPPTIDNATVATIGLVSANASLVLDNTTLDAAPDAAPVEFTFPDTTGIESLTFGGGTPVTETGETGVFTTDLVADFVGGTTVPVSVLLTLTGDAPVLSQTVAASASAVVGTGASATTVSSVAGSFALTRAGTESAAFELVNLEGIDVFDPGTIFRFNNLDTSAGPPQIFVNITDLTTGGGDDAAILDFDLTANFDNPAVGAGDLLDSIFQGELQLTAVLLGDIINESPLGDGEDFSLAAADGEDFVTRGTVTFTVEQEGVIVRRLLVTGGNFSVSTYTADFDVVDPATGAVVSTIDADVDN